MKNRHLRKKEMDWCACKDHNAKEWTVVADFYAKHFIPEKWVFEYRTIHCHEDKRVLYLFGHCDHCGGMMRSGTSVPTNVKDDELLAYVYREMVYYRPYDFCDSHSGTYHGCVNIRARWYQRQDCLTLEARDKQFLRLFQKKDRTTVTEWLIRNRNYPPGGKEGGS